MAHEVVVVGGGVGGLTVAALLAARGVDVCLLERGSSVGGCAAGFEKFGYTFDPGVGLYPFWQPGAIHDQELMLDENGFSDDRTDATWTQESGECSDDMNEKDDELAHLTILTRTANPRDCAVN